MTVASSLRVVESNWIRFTISMRVLERVFPPHSDPNPELPRRTFGEDLVLCSDFFRDDPMFIRIFDFLCSKVIETVRIRSPGVNLLSKDLSVVKHGP